MSRAFVKENNEDLASEELPERPVSSEPNYVTQAGFEGLRAKVDQLDAEHAGVRQTGYDALRRNGRRVERLQIKGRRVLPRSKPSQRVGSIQLDKPWDAVVLVLLDEDFETTEIYEASRRAVRKALLTPGSTARNRRGALGVREFKLIGQRVWPPEIRQGSAES
jgi:hypothetical protein